MLNRTSARAVTFFKTIATLFKLRKIKAGAWVVDCLAASILFEIGLGYVGTQTATIVDEHIIPRLISTGLCFVAFIPSITCHATRVNRDNSAAIAVELVSHNKTEIVYDTG